MGDVGTGKTHLACALAAMCCARGWEARFFTASSLVLRLRRARDEGRLDRELSQLGRAHAGDRRARVPAARRRRRPAPVPGDLGGLREAVGGDHDEPRVLPLGPDVRRRADGGGRDRPRGAPRQTAPVQGQSYRVRHALMRGTAVAQDR